MEGPLTAQAPNRNPFVREGHVSKAGIIGSHWWNRELGEAAALKTRRSLITALAASAVGVAMIGLAVSAAVDDGAREERRPSLDVQREFGWNFGATSETVAFDATYTTTYAAEALPRLMRDLTPVSKTFQKWYVPTLLQAPWASPRTIVLSDDGPATSLATALKPIYTPAMKVAEAAGKALAVLLTLATEGKVAIVFDLDGPQAVAAAAGACSWFEPVCLFENWPHPRGVVAAHLTLAAAVYYQPQFAQAQRIRSPNDAPAFVLDRQRLAPYTDDENQFDNRWLARLPSAQDMVSAEIKRVMYVTNAKTAPVDLRDVGTTLAEWVLKGIQVRAINIDAFYPGVDSTVRFGGSRGAQDGFFAHYKWKVPPPVPTPIAVPVPENEAAVIWQAAPQLPDPGDQTLGTVRVKVDKETNQVTGPYALRSGSFNRASGSSWGGG
ncbi:MAG: hypothetical protein IPK82_33120 [Polyangiaceae bacterium]|nr:hypothetical protein [Polyangiaceae bacterium]